MIHFPFSGSLQLDILSNPYIYIYITKEEYKGCLDIEFVLVTFRLTMCFLIVLRMRYVKEQCNEQRAPKKDVPDLG